MSCQMDKMEQVWTPCAIFFLTQRLSLGITITVKKIHMAQLILM